MDGPGSCSWGYPALPPLEEWFLLDSPEMIDVAWALGYSVGFGGVVASLWGS